MLYLLDLKEGDKITLDYPKEYLENADLPNYNAAVASKFETAKVATLLSVPYNKSFGATFDIDGISFFIPHWECKYFSKVAGDSRC